MKKILWIGAGGNHEPGENHPACLHYGIFWHYKKNSNTLFNYLNDNYDLLYGNPLSFNINNNKLFMKGENIDDFLKKCECIFLLVIIEMV